LGTSTIAEVKQGDSVNQTLGTDEFGHSTLLGNAPFLINALVEGQKYGIDVYVNTLSHSEFFNGDSLKEAE
jgi:hypothetical protein